MNTKKHSVGLSEQGFRFVRIGNEFTWALPSVLDYQGIRYIDCTDMNVKQLTAHVADADLSKKRQAA